MATYTCLDGPLEGRTLRWRRGLPAAGQPVTVALLDVGHGVLEIDYKVQRPADRSGAGHLTFVAARPSQGRGRWRAPSLPLLGL